MTNVGDQCKIPILLQQVTKESCCSRYSKQTLQKAVIFAGLQWMCARMSDSHSECWSQHHEGHEHMSHMTLILFSIVSIWIILVKIWAFLYAVVNIYIQMKRLQICWNCWTISPSNQVLICYQYVQNPGKLWSFAVGEALVSTWDVTLVWETLKH